MSHERYAYPNGVRVEDPKVTRVYFLLWFTDLSMLHLSIPMATRVKAWDGGCSLLGIAGSKKKNPAGGMDVCTF